MDCKITNVKIVNSPKTIMYKGEEIKLFNDINEAVKELKKGNEIARFEFCN